MRPRSVKLREAHKINNGIPSFCSVIWDKGAEHILTASSSDNVISVYDSLLLQSTAPKLLRHHRDGVTALALSPNSTCLASGSIDHSVKLYKFPSGDFETNITRFTLPIRTLSFNKSGSILAAAGDDEGIKLINTIDGTISRVLKGHQGSITCIAFDPNNEYLASIDSKGTVISWELESGTILNTLKGRAPDIGSDESIFNMVRWSPDGSLLAVPGLKRDVVMYDRDTSEKMFTLRGDHEQSICSICWSPNGKYVATSGLDKQVIVWDVDKRQDIDRQKFDEIICSIMWKPNGNALAVIDVMGKVGVWESVIPSSMKSPTENIPNSQSNKSEGLVFFDEEEKDPGLSSNLSDQVEDLLDEEYSASRRKRLRKHAMFDENSDEDLDEELPLKKSSHAPKEPVASKSEFSSTTTKMQDAFQPGSTPIQPGIRCFMCYNMVGSIITIEQDGFSRIEIDFHDTSQGPRVPSMTDYFGFSMAAMNEKGCVFANACKGEKNMSTLMYRPFSSWANNSEWSMRLEGEEVKAVALGDTWVAAVTNRNCLRIFTEGGLQKHVISLDGPVVTAVGSRDELAVVTHASSALPNNDQMLNFRVFNIANGTQALKGRLPLSPSSTLVWFGFSEEGHLSSYDSKGELRVYTQQFGGSWLPIFSADKEKKSGEHYWVVGLNAEKLYCIACKSPDVHPKVVPKPVLTLLDLSIPLASSDLGADSLENEFIMRNISLSETQRKISEMLVAGLDTTKLEYEAIDKEALLDRCILRLIASCCNGDKLVRATELVKLLALEKSVTGAIKLVTTLKLPQLAERFSNILEERLLKEAAKVSTHSTHSNTKVFNTTDVYKTPNSTTVPRTKSFSLSDKDKKMSITKTIGAASPADSNKSCGLNTPPSSHLTLLRKKTKVQEDRISSSVAEDEAGKNSSLDSTQEMAMKAGKMENGNNKIKSKAEVNHQVISSGNLFVKSSNSEKDVRPTNPFARSSRVNEESLPSLLHSLQSSKADAPTR